MEALLADISAQPQVLSAHADRIAAAADLFRTLAATSGSRMVFTGIATSLFSWRSAELSLLRAVADPPWVVDTADLLDYGPDLSADPRPLVVLSRSGESAEIVRLMESVGPRRTVVGITEDAGSTLARRADHLLLFAAAERAFPNTKSFVLSMAYARACAQGLGAGPRLPAAAWVQEAATAIAELLDRDREGVRAVARLLAGSAAALLVGRGHVAGVVQQAAMDLQEGIRIAALPVAGGVFRHGTIELTARPDVTTLLAAPAGPTAALQLRLAEDLRDGSAPVAVVADDSLPVPDGVPVVRVPDTRPELAPLTHAVALQLVAVEIARTCGLRDIRPQLVEKVTRQE